MTRFFFLIGVAFCVFLLGCDEAVLMKKYAPLQDEPIAREYLDLLTQGKVDQIEHDMDPSVSDPGSRDTLVKLAQMLPVEPPKSVKVVGARVKYGAGFSTIGVTYECQFPNMWYLVNVDLQKRGNVLTVRGFDIRRLADSLEEMHKFSLLGKGAAQYKVFALAILAALFSLYALVLCIRTKTGAMRWMWVSVILVGVARLSVNWTTGELGFTVWAIQVPCASATAPLYGPWTIAAYLPLGAMFFLNERWRDRVLGRPTNWPNW
jgi:hypothetical protein